ncbi:MAG: hypothetical protein IJY15_05150 [Thermoguttaceae bacterium]|nr:hypothetical protein [Thermoguttaceae bacterium]
MAWRGNIQWLSGLNGEARCETESRPNDRVLILTLDGFCCVAKTFKGGYCSISTSCCSYNDVGRGGEVVAVALLEDVFPDIFGDKTFDAVARIQKKIEELKARAPDLLGKVEAFVDGMLAATKTLETAAD